LACDWTGRVVFESWFSAKNLSDRFRLIFFSFALVGRPLPVTYSQRWSAVSPRQTIKNDIARDFGD